MHAILLSATQPKDVVQEDFTLTIYKYEALIQSL